MQKLREACDKEGRDINTMRKSVQALFFVTPDEASAENLKTKVPMERSIVGTTSQIVDAIGQYVDQGFDEVCVPDFTLGGSAAQRLDAYGSIWTNIASQFQ
jgi:alkanesulfonate monooxygenase SsuD/methylene tetrahydromethanopterin reductase-like flavin-dependent oxidoreductase (luciferase family)